MVDEVVAAVSPGRAFVKVSAFPLHRLFLCLLSLSLHRLSSPAPTSLLKGPPKALLPARVEGRFPAHR